MQYMLLIYINDTEPGPDVLMPAYDTFTSELHREGKFVYANRLEGPGRAATVRVNNGNTLVTDGPFAETKEWLCGFYIVDCKDKADAIAIAAKIPSSPYGAVEVLPVIE